MKTTFNIIGLLGLCSFTFIATFSISSLMVQFFIEMPFVTVGVYTLIWGVVFMFKHHPDDDIMDLLK